MSLTRLLTARPYLAASIAVHGLLLAWLARYGSYEIEQRRVDAEVAASVQATAQARMERRVEDLKKIKELLEESANRPPEAPADAAAPKDTVEEARELAKAIETLGRELKAEEQAKLTGQKVDEARAELEAKDKQAPASAKPPADDAAEVAALEQKAREVLAERAAQMQRQQEGVAVSHDGAGGAQSDGQGQGKGQGEGSGNGKGKGTSGNGAAAMAGRMAALLGTDVEPDRPSQAYGNEARDIFGGPAFTFPRVDAKAAVKGQGRMLGAGGSYANRVYVNSWYLIGPFEGTHGTGLFHNPSYPPEDAVLLDATYYGKNKRVLKWQYVTENAYPVIPRDLAEDSVYYGYTEVLMDQERDLKVWIGADDDASVKINGQLVWKGGNAHKQGFFDAIYDGGASVYLRDYNRNEGVRVVHFKKGRNTVFFKLSNGPTRVFFSMVLTPV